MQRRRRDLSRWYLPVLALLVLGTSCLDATGEGRDDAESTGSDESASAGDGNGDGGGDGGNDGGDGDGDGDGDGGAEPSTQRNPLISKPASPLFIWTYIRKPSCGWLLHEPLSAAQGASIMMFPFANIWRSSGRPTVLSHSTSYGNGLLSHFG